MIETLQLFLVSLFISVTTFGGGAQALYYGHAVQQAQWITAADLSAVLAFGYATPGPAVFGTSSFIGYSLSGFLGVIVGAIGIFIVPFFAAIIAVKYFAKLLLSPRGLYFIKGVGLAITGLIASTAVLLIQNITGFNGYLIITAIAFILSVRYKTNPLFIIIGGLLVAIVIGY